MKKALNAETAPPAAGPYSHAVIAGDFIFTTVPSEMTIAIEIDAVLWIGGRS